MRDRKGAQLSIDTRTEVESSQASAPTILTLVDLTAHDAPVVDAARALAGAHRATIVLLHVARSLPRRRRASDAMLAIDAAAHRAVRRLARRRLPRSLPVQTSVRFGDVVEQVAKAVIAVGATVVVAASRPARWRWWRNRDRRLGRHLDVPVILVAEPGPEPDRSRGMTRGEPRRTRVAA
jgi:hypothetical protein